MIADSLETIIQIFYRIAQESGYESLCQLDIEQVRHLNLKERIQLTDLSFWQILFLMRKVNKSIKLEAIAHPMW